MPPMFSGITIALEIVAGRAALRRRQSRIVTEMAVPTSPSASLSCHLNSTVAIPAAAAVLSLGRAMRRLNIPYHLRAPAGSVQRYGIL